MTIASHQDIYLRLVECGTDAVYDDVTGKLQKTLTAFPLRVLPLILRYFAKNDMQLLAWVEVLCYRYGNVDREQRRELQGQYNQGAGDGSVEEPGKTEVNGNKHRDEGAEKPPVALEIQQREPADGQGELRLGWRKYIELAKEPVPEFRLSKPTAKGAGAENPLESNRDISAKTELGASPSEFREILSSVLMEAKACIAEGTAEEKSPKCKRDDILPASDNETESETSQLELRRIPSPVPIEAKACPAEGTKRDNSSKPDRGVLPASDSETGSEASQLELREITSPVPMEAMACTAEGMRREKSPNPNTDDLPANDSETRSEVTLELREIPSPVPVGTNPCTTEGTEMKKSQQPNAYIPQASKSETGSEVTDVYNSCELHEVNSRPRVEAQQTGTKIKYAEHSTEIQDTSEDPESEIWNKQDGISEQKIQDTIPKQEIQDKTEDKNIQNTELEQQVHMLTKTDLIREGVLKESELQDIREKLQEMVKYDKQYQKFIGIVERLQLNIPFQSKSKGIILTLIKSVKTTWEQTYQEGKGRDTDDGDDEEKEMSLGFVLQSLRNKSKNSSVDLSKIPEACQEVQLRGERQHDREIRSQSTSETCASEPTEAEHADSEMQEEFSNQHKLTKDLPSTKCPKLPLENYPSVREKKLEYTLCERKDATASVISQETAQDSIPCRRAPSRGRGKFNLCSVRRPDFDYREDTTGARPKNVFFRGRPSQEDLSIFDEKDASSSTLSKVTSSRIVSEGGKHLLPSPDIPTGIGSSSAPSVGDAPFLTHA
ncbi:enolase-phosphatase E1-like isoform X2 [Penaeus vannamei]|uniref:enolase-phosphatase E1-like isoform X2 n=1 Tax=Penaeus vannamei TaxID=6689 RepID=UPI00387F8D9F